MSTPAAQIAFLTARYDEEEVTARAAAETGHEGWGPGTRWMTSVGWDSDYGPVPWVSLSPERALADIAAKRVTIQEAERLTELDKSMLAEERSPDPGPPYLGTAFITALLQPYTEHPDFDPTWRTT